MSEYSLSVAKLTLSSGSQNLCGSQNLGLNMRYERVSFDFAQANFNRYNGSRGITNGVVPPHQGLVEFAPTTMIWTLVHSTVKYSIRLAYTNYTTDFKMISLSHWNGDLFSDVVCRLGL